MTTSSFVMKHILKLLACWLALALIGMAPAPIASAAVPRSITFSINCSSVSFTATYASNRWTTNSVTTTCNGTTAITISATLYINGNKTDTASKTCLAASSCTLRALTGAGPQNATWRVSDISIKVPTATCSGPTPTSYYANGQRISNPVVVTCKAPDGSAMYGTITVSGKLFINGVEKASKSATCNRASTCTLPSMSAAAKQTDQWSVSYR